MILSAISAVKYETSEEHKVCKTLFLKSPFPSRLATTGTGHKSMSFIAHGIVINVMYNNTRHCYMTTIVIHENTFGVVQVTTKVN